MLNLYELSNDELMKVTCEVMEPIASIMNDDDLQKKMGSIVTKGKSRLAVTSAMLNALLPVIAENHKNDLYKILAVLNEKTVEEIAAQNGMATIKQAKEALSSGIMDFFG